MLDFEFHRRSFDFAFLNIASISLSKKSKEIEMNKNVSRIFKKHLQILSRIFNNIQIFIFCEIIQNKYSFVKLRNGVMEFFPLIVIRILSV